jgi:uncharacterized protein (TIGR02452 family)
MHINRDRAAALGRETMEILERGWYTSPAGQRVEIAGLVRRAVEGTISYPPGSPLPEPRPGDLDTALEVTDETTLAAARRLVADGYRPAALNFASAKNPGGGFLSGARAQEESLARSSALVACLDGNPMYDFHRQRHDPLYTDYVLYSPDVPVFRDDEGVLLKEPCLCTFLTAPAPNAGVALERDPGRRPEITRALERRVRKVLAIGQGHGHSALVLGAWGCGVYKNDPAEVAGLFSEALRGPFRGAFERVVFAVVDWSADRRTISPFERMFGS